MQRVIWCVGLATLLYLIGGPVAAQTIVNEIDLDDGDPNLVPDSPFGALVSPDGRFLLVCISGDPDLDPNPPQLNNNQVRVIDRETESVVNVITTGFFPVECAVTVHGTDRFLYVANSSDGNLSVFRVANGDFHDPASVSEEAASPIDTGFLSFPSGLAVTADQKSVLVSTNAGNGEIHRIDADPSSPTFNSIVETLIVPGGLNRIAVYGDDLVVTQSVYDGTFTYSWARVTILDLGDPVDRREIYLTPELDAGVGEFASTIDVAVRADGTAWVTVLGPGTGSNLFGIDVPGRSLARTINLEATQGEGLHGIGISPDGRFAAVTNLDSSKLAILDLASDSITTILDTPDLPNEAVWSLDGSRLYVTNQGAHSVSVVSGFEPGPLALSGTTTPSLGGQLELVLCGGIEDMKGGVVYSETGNGGGTFKGIPVPISDPVRVLGAGNFDAAGRFEPAPVTVPNDPSLIGRAVYYLGATRDVSGSVRLSNVLTAIYQP